MKKNSKSFLCTNKLRTYLFWLVLYFIFNFGSAFSQDRSGLWVGEVLLGKVAEVSVPLDENNIPRAPDPDTPTETSDSLSLRLIIHVDSAGVFRLLKDVAILKRNPNNLDAVLEGDISLITDPSLYSDFPGQFAQRITSPTFDFGDDNATEIVTKIMDYAVNAGIWKIQRNANASEEEIKTAAKTAADSIISAADVDKQFDNYLKAHLTGQKIRAAALNSKWPTGASPQKAIDGDIETKYINEAVTNTGIIITLTTPSKVVKIEFGTANNEVNRDPATFILYGTNDAIVSTDNSNGTDENWSKITNAPLQLALPDQRNARTIFQNFTNTNQYSSYKLIFPTLKGNANSMQIAEIQFYDENDQQIIQQTDRAIAVREAANFVYQAGSTLYPSGTSVPWVLDNNYAHPNNTTQTADSDGDGVPDLNDPDWTVMPFKYNRINEMVNYLNLVLQENIIESLKINKLHNTAASFVDSAVEYERFLSGYYISQMIQGAAEEAARQKIANPLTVRDQIIDEITNNQKVKDAVREAFAIRVNLYDDTRGEDAINEIISDIADFALSSTQTNESALKRDLMNEGLRSLRDDVTRYPMPSTAPSSGYNSFINTVAFNGAAKLVSEAVASAIIEDKSKTFSDNSSKRSAANIAAASSLQSLFALAARVNSSEIVMTGSFPNQVSATIKLPAMHPTNPFRHRRNPDHVAGFDVIRKINLKYVDNSNSDPIQGIYEEEILGLHKPLGPQKDKGLKVEGAFKLYRVSDVKTLNGN